MDSKALDLSTHLDAPTYTLLAVAGTASTILFSGGCQVVLSTFIPSPRTGVTVFFVVFSVLIRVGRGGIRGSTFVYLGVYSTRRVFVPLRPREGWGGSVCWLGGWDCI